jgi:hypothetical protein
MATMLASSSWFVQRIQVSIGIHQYATELGNILEEGRSEEENSFIELRKIIVEGQFGDEQVQVDAFTAASVQNGRIPIKKMREMRCQREDCWILIAEKRVGGMIDDVGKHDLWMLCASYLIKVHWYSEWAQKRL